jgi:hypothetical protein
MAKSSRVSASVVLLSPILMFKSFGISLEVLWTGGLRQLKFEVSGISMAGGWRISDHSARLVCLVGNLLRR